MNKKRILICGIPSSGKSTMGLRLHLELEWAGKTTVLLDDETIKRVTEPEKISTLIYLLNSEYNIIVTPFIQKMPFRPNLIVWCRCPIEECLKRDKIKAIGGRVATLQDFQEEWGNYQIEADLILDTYDRGRKTKENIEFCWQKLKRKMEELFGDFSWRICANDKSDWASKEPGKQYPF